MKLSVSVFRGVLLLLSLGFISGCLPSAPGPGEEEREPHFLAGKSRVNALDYKGAIESFEKALEINPQSAAAHFELGCLFEQKEVADPAAAIFHYDHYLKLRPAGENAERARQHIVACKEELARAVSLAPVTEKLQHELEQLTEENKRLAAQNKLLQDELEKARAPAARRAVPADAPAPAESTRLAAARAATAAAAGSAPVASARTHTVKAGESPSLIARRYGVKLEALMAANPGLDPRRLQVGQSLNIPAP